jgi:1,4-dihydroxy-6-naphthoate synthase
VRINRCLPEPYIRVMKGKDDKMNTLSATTALRVGISPCPNDTFMFHAWANRPDVELCLLDVETLNEAAFSGRFDVTKLSYAALLHLEEGYEPLAVGSALGRGCGPLVIGTKAGPLLPTMKIAVPGRYTTAHLLLRLWNPALTNRVFMPFDQIMGAVASGEVDAGVMIHEGRFTYQTRGFQLVQDLGAWWEQESGLPIPLGCIAVKRSLGRVRIAAVESALRESIDRALADPAAALPFVRMHAQELDDAVTQQHIMTYVNAFSRDLGAEGRAAIVELKRRAVEAGVIQ